MDLFFEELTLKIENRQSGEGSERVILNGVSGIIKAGEVTAIMGASGAGKTTLLNIISCRISKFDGKLYANTENYNY